MAFENAGQEPGIQVWRIEDFEAVVYDNIGNFHVGDSYIVLKVCVFIINDTIVLSSIITENLNWKCETILNLTSTIKNFNVHIKSTFYRPKCIFFNTGNVLVHHW